MNELTERKRALNDYNERYFEIDSNKLPNTLDIVKINGRWAQVYYPGGGGIIFLDNGLRASINWKDYKMVRSFAGWSVDSLRGLENFTPEEMLNIRWGPEQEAYPYLKGFVSVFGAYISRLWPSR